jgi:hypothetical protein
MRALFLAAVLLMLAPAAQAAEPSGLYVLAINGGGDKLDNFASHLAHLRQLTDLLAASGIPRDHITVLASDGSNPAPDLATREPEPENAWLLQGTRVDSLLRDLTTYEDSVLPGIDLRPATVASLSRTLGELRGRLHAGDTLLVYVTDHGTQSQRDPIENRITLWGPHESISVRKLGALLARLPPSVRVVSLMSQCFSGGFAYLHEAREHKRLPSGKTCGYFSSTPDRPAYGCYPEVRGQKAIGHSFEFLTALARRGRFPAAHADIMVSDETPDIPLRSSDVYLAEQIARAAGSPEREAAFADPLVGQAFAGRDFVEESRLIDRIAAVYAFARPASLAELDERVHALFAFLDQLELDGKTWEGALGDFNQANLDAFVASQPRGSRARCCCSAWPRAGAARRPGALRDVRSIALGRGQSAGHGTYHHRRDQLSQRDPRGRASAHALRAYFGGRTPVEQARPAPGAGGRGAHPLRGSGLARAGATAHGRTSCSA